MVWQPMKGVKVVEVAQFTFTPSAGAVLADWGADVIKVEHAVTGDAQRGCTIGAGRCAAGSFQPIMEHPNRGKRSIGLALEDPEALDGALRARPRRATSSSPTSCPTRATTAADRRRGHPRASTRSIIYVRGSGHGRRGPDAEKGGYDGSTFWSRGGSAWRRDTRRTAPRVLGMPAGAFGDSMGGMTIAGGIAAALFARERTGEPSVVDVSLLERGRVGDGARGRHLAADRRADRRRRCATAEIVAVSTRSSAACGRRTAGGSP